MWKEVWDSKGRAEFTTAPDLNDRLNAGGWTSGAGGIVSEKAWMAYADNVALSLGLRGGESVFEIGCGAGAFLVALMRRHELTVSGVDIAQSQVALAQRAIPEGRFEIADAAEDPVPSAIIEGVKHSDVTVVNGVVAYLPGTAVVERLITVLSGAPGNAAILDVPDARFREQRESARRSLLPPGEYQRRYQSSGLRHLYLDPDWLIHKGELAGFSVDIVSQEIVGFNQSQFHFNAYLFR